MEMRRNILIVALSFALLPVVARGQQQNKPLPMITQQEIYCSGAVTTTPISRSTEIVSGEQALYKITFDQGDYIYINRGADKGVNVGDVFSVMRPIDDWTGIPWFWSQDKLVHEMGQMWQDEGQIKVVQVYQKTSIAQITNSCDFMQRGDVVRPFAQLPVPELKSEANFDRFAPWSGKKKALVVTGKYFRSTAGTNDIVYVNLGSKQGVKVGDYFRIYRYQDNRDDTSYLEPNMGTEAFGYGAAPGHPNPKDLPREILGEGVVLRATPNASTVLITFSLREIYDGDYCELE
jgi:hypothetical protein